jgi:hypothetical protein
MPQLVTAEDRENYADQLIDMTMRAARETLAPELQQLRAENQQLRGMAQRSQRDAIERALDAQVPTWREIYQDPRFSEWLSMPDDYSGSVRSQLLRSAVANGDSARVAAIYRGFQQASGGQHGQARSHRRPPAIGGAAHLQQSANCGFV